MRRPLSFMHGSKNQPKTRVIFVTGTDTGVGKTLLSCLLLVHLRERGSAALGIKPFCSGTRADVRLLRWAQGSQLTESEINPFYFREPVAPFVAARQHRRTIEPEAVVAHVAGIVAGCEFLLIEGAGGLLVPISKSFCTLDLILRLRCDVIVVSRNRLGTINHTLLTVKALQHAGIQHSSGNTQVPRLLNVVLMDHRLRDASFASNAQILREFLDRIPLIAVPFLRGNCASPAGLEANQKKIKNILARIVR